MSKDELLFDVARSIDGYMVELFRDRGLVTIFVNGKLVEVTRGLSQMYYGHIPICERFIDRTDIDADTYVSTVFIGNTFGGNYMFETMIFGGDAEFGKDRCNTPDEARKIHRSLVDYARHYKKLADKPCSRQSKKALARLSRTLKLAKKRGHSWVTKKMLSIGNTMKRLRQEDPIRLKKWIEEKIAD